MANKIEYEFTWCDFLTPCPNGMDCMVGDYKIEKYIPLKNEN